MASTKPLRILPSRRFDWRAAGLPYYAYSFHLRQLFGRRVQRVSVDAGMTCPNVDGTVAIGGCTFCDNRSFSPSRRLPRGTLLDQIDEGIRRLKRRYKCDDYMAYFQPATNTYAPPDQLRAWYEKVLEHPQVVALAIGTRPDCVPDEVLDVLEQMARRVYLSVEYGMQTMHDRSLDWMNRGHHHDAMVDAMERSFGRGFEICAHLMLGLPGESREDMLATAQEVNRLGIDAVKLHNLYAVKDTPLGGEVAAGRLVLMSREEYIATLVDVLEVLDPRIVVERISGEAPLDYFVAPSWSLDKPGVLRALQGELRRRGSCQGSRYEPPERQITSP